jgi:hypothetical protein
VRSAVPMLTLDEAFESKDHVAEQVKHGLQVGGMTRAPIRGHCDVSRHTVRAGVRWLAVVCRTK